VNGLPSLADAARSRVSSSVSSPNFRVQLVLPLFHQPAGCDDQHPLQIAAQHQLFGVQAGHDGLAGPWIIGEQEPQRGAGQQFLIDGFDLVRQRTNVARAEAPARDALRVGVDVERRDSSRRVVLQGNTQMLIA
jgi:hypothetical protein